MTVLFRAPQLQFDLVMGLVWVGAYVYGVIKTSKEELSLVGQIILWVFRIGFGILALYCSFMVFSSLFQAIRIVTRPDIQTIEGYVENYSLTPAGAHSVESFEIDGVRFSYPPAGNSWCYETVKSNGGVVRGDGQYLRIRYFASTISQGDKDVPVNCIVYIAEDPEKSSTGDGSLCWSIVFSN